MELSSDKNQGWTFYSLPTWETTSSWSYFRSHMDRASSRASTLLSVLMVVWHFVWYFSTPYSPESGWFSDTSGLLQFSWPKFSLGLSAGQPYCWFLLLKYHNWYGNLCSFILSTWPNHVNLHIWICYSTADYWPRSTTGSAVHLLHLGLGMLHSINTLSFIVHIPDGPIENTPVRCTPVSSSLPKVLFQPVRVEQKSKLSW